MKRMMLFALVLVVMTGCSTEESGTLKTLPAVRTVIETVQLQDISDHVAAPGRITSRTDAMVSAKVMGTITEISVNAGQTVEKGQSLATIDSADIRSRLQQAKGALAQARAGLVIAENNAHRYRELYQKNACSKVELEQMEFQFEAAKGAVETATGAIQEARSYLAYAAVTAPFSGVVVERMANVGDFAAPGKPLFRLIDPEKLVFECTVSDSMAGTPNTGDEAHVTLDGLTAAVSGTVIEKSGGSDTYTHSILVRISLPETPGLRAGMYGSATFVGASHRRVVIPESWIVQRGALQFVYLVGSKDGRAQLRLVRTGRRLTDGIEVISGLAGGERIAVKNLHAIHDGCKLEPTQ